MANLDTVQPASVRPPTRTTLARLIRRPEAGAFGALVAVYLLFAVATQGAGFVSVQGTYSWLNQAAELGIIVVPVGLLMIAGEFDLSIGSTVAAAGMIVAIGTHTYGVPIWYCIALALLLGAAVGAINGFVVTRTKLPSFIVTLAMNFSLAGATIGMSRLLTNTTTVSIPLSPTAKAVFGSKLIGGANVSILWWLIFVIVGSWVLGKTVFGNWILATGGHQESARAAGVPTARVKMILFVVTGVASAFVGLLSAITFNAGNAAVGQNFVFEAVIASVIGGVALHGGYGSVIGIALGTAIYGAISVGVFYTGWPTEWIGFFLGILLFFAVLTNSYFRRLALQSK